MMELITMVPDPFEPRSPRLPLRELGLPLSQLPSAAIFDCDGTLVDTMPRHYQGWRTVLDSYGCEFTEARFYEWGGVPPDEVVRRLNAEQGVAIPVHEACSRVEREFAVRASNPPPIEEVVAEVHRLHGKVPLGVGSSGARSNVESCLEHIGILHLFDAVVVAADVDAGKPEPDIFLQVSLLLKVEATGCVVFEDTNSGIEAARRAGMSFVDVRKHIRRGGIGHA